MADESRNPICGWTKLFHPRGPQVTLPLPPDPAAALAAVSAALDAGWLVQAPGLEEGEEKEQVGWVVHGSFERDGKETPYVLLYSANEAMKHSFLKVYLNSEENIAAFEYAARLKLDSLPLYIGQDKPERGKSKAIDRFITQAPRPFGVVFKGNPKYQEHAAAAARAQGEIYSVPKRVFVRWADTAPDAATPDVSAQATPAEVDALEAKMVEREAATGKKVNLSRFLHFLGAATVQSLTQGQLRKGMESLQGDIDAAKKGGAA